MSSSACDTVRDDLTAWIDGELPPRRSEQVGQHVESCDACAAESANLRLAITEHRHLLAGLADVGVDAVSLRQSLRQGMAEMKAQATPSVWLAWKPRLLTAAAAAAAVFTVMWIAGGPAAVFIPLGLEAPPPAVAREPTLFRDYPLIQNLDVLENLERLGPEATPPMRSSMG
jgi:anti-sigma factor RsiW